MVEESNLEKKESVCVVIPTCSRADMLRRAVTSVLRSTRAPDQLIIINDSDEIITENSLCETASSTLSETHISVINPGKIGVQKARNLGLEICNCNYVMFLDDDDEITDNRIRMFVEEWTGKDSFLFSDDYFSRQGGQTCKTERPNAISIEMILQDNWVGNQVFTKAERIRAVGGYDISLQAGQDYDLWIRLIDKYGAARKIDGAEQVVNVGHGSITYSTKRRKGYYQVFKKFKNKMPLELRAWKYIYLRYHGNRRVPMKFLLCVLRKKSLRMVHYTAVYYCFRTLPVANVAATMLSGLRNMRRKSFAKNTEMLGKKQ